MEADISIWRKSGHFYFALTRTGNSSVARSVFFVCASQPPFQAEEKGTLGHSLRTI